MAQVQQLYHLQQIDNEIKEKKQRLGDVLRAQKASEALLAARQQAEAAAQKQKQWHSKHGGLTLELGSLNSKAQSAESRLYSGSVKNPKELADLEHQMAALGRQRHALEEDLLEALIMLEEAQAEKTAVDQTLATTEADWQRHQAHLKQEQDGLALRLYHLGNIRKEQATLVEPRLLQEYEQLARQLGGVAVAGLRINSCLSCRITVSVIKAKDVHEGKIVYCGGCGRILSPM